MGSEMCIRDRHVVDPEVASIDKHKSGVIKKAERAFLYVTPQMVRRYRDLERILRKLMKYKLS